jgi:hypothetical protein
MILITQMPGAMAAMEADAPGTHTTDGFDYVLVVSGEATLEPDDGEQTVLRAGDVVVQNGTRHAWRNHGTEPCTIVGVAIGADLTRPAWSGSLSRPTADTESADRRHTLPGPHRHPVAGTRPVPPPAARRHRGHPGTRPEVTGQRRTPDSVFIDVAWCR